MDQSEKNNGIRANIRGSFHCCAKNCLERVELKKRQEKENWSEIQCGKESQNQLQKMEVRTTVRKLRAKRMRSETLVEKKTTRDQVWIYPTPN